ncbi:sugar ABC transporter substrate-binding protein [Lentzea pudingi]|nr:substrate-binding domain-containing protein [Lentzea pudingi]
MLGLAACTGAETQQTTEGEGGREVNIAFSTSVPAGEDSRVILMGVERAAQDLGPVRFTFEPPANYDPIAAQRQTTDLLSTRPDAMAIAPQPPDVWQRTLTQVADQVEAVTYQAKPVGTADQVGNAVIRTYVGANDTTLGREALRATIDNARLGPETTGTVLLGTCVPQTVGSLYERVQGFRQAVAERLPRAQIKEFDSKPEPRENINAWEAAIQSTPDAVVGIGACDQDGASLHNIKTRSGARLAAGALETPPEVLRGLREGTIAAAVSDNYWLMGYITTRLLVERARGGPELPEGFIDTGFTVVNRDNVDQIEQRNSTPETLASGYAPRVEELFGDLAKHVRPLAEAW